MGICILIYVSKITVIETFYSICISRLSRRFSLKHPLCKLMSLPDHPKCHALGTSSMFILTNTYVTVRCIHPPLNLLQLIFVKRKHQTPIWFKCVFSKHQVNQSDVLQFSHVRCRVLEPKPSYHWAFCGTMAIATSCDTNQAGPLDPWGQVTSP